MQREGERESESAAGLPESETGSDTGRQTRALLVHKSMQGVVDAPGLWREPVNRQRMLRQVRQLHIALEVPQHGAVQLQALQGAAAVQAGS